MLLAQNFVGKQLTPKIYLYPIPAHTHLMVEMDSIDTCKVQLYSIVGQKVITAIPESSLNRIRIQTLHLKHGIYALHIYKKTALIARKRILIKY